MLYEVITNAQRLARQPVCIKEIVDMSAIVHRRGIFDRNDDTIGRIKGILGVDIEVGPGVDNDDAGKS